MYIINIAFQVAYSIFGAKGIVLDIKVGNDATCFWNCNYWSTYVNENERFLIGGKDFLYFTTIRDVPRCLNYESAINVMTIFNEMVVGHQLGGIVPSSADVALLGHIIDAVSFPSDKMQRKSISAYVYQLFIHFLQKQEDVLINWDDWKKHKMEYVKHLNFHGYGYKKFQKYFVDDIDSNNSVLKYSIFIGIMPNIHTFTVIDMPKIGALNYSISLTKNLVVELMKCIEILNKLSFTSFEHFRFVKPNGNIKNFIDEYQNEFESKGCKLCHESYQYTPFKLDESDSLIVRRV